MHLRHTQKFHPSIKHTLCAGLAATALAITASIAVAQTHTGGKGTGHDSSATSHDSGHTSHADSGGQARGKRGGEAGRGKGGGHQSLRDVFRDMEDEAKAENGKKGKGGPAASAKPEKPATAAKTGQGKKPVKEVAEDSDRPAWAGTSGPEGKPGRPNLEPGVKKGTIYGDMYIVLRDVDGVPILDGDYVQVMFVVDGKLVCCIDRDAEGNLLTTGTTSDGTTYANVVPLEVELGRLSVGRSPTRVLAAQLEEAISAINEATSVDFDASGRIVLTLSDGTTKTIDSPLENLALYVELLNTGTLADVGADKLASLGIDATSTISTQEFDVASSFFAAASDKTISISVDSIVYMNAILGIDGALDGDYVNYSTFTYDREATFKDLTVEVLTTSDGGTTWVKETVNVYDVVFNSTDLDAANVAAFTAAADDARLVINFLHEYTVPTLPTSN